MGVADCMFVVCVCVCVCECECECVCTVCATHAISGTTVHTQLLLTIVFAPMCVDLYNSSSSTNKCLKNVYFYPLIIIRETQIFGFYILNILE